MGVPKIPPEVREGPLSVGNPKGFGVDVKGLALGLSLVEVLWFSSFCFGVADPGFALVCFSSMSPMKRGS